MVNQQTKSQTSLPYLLRAWCHSNFPYCHRTSSHGHLAGIHQVQSMEYQAGFLPWDAERKAGPAVARKLPSSGGRCLTVAFEPVFGDRDLTSALRKADSVVLGWSQQC